MKATSELIKQGFWDLLREKPYNKITVKDIVEKCHVNRNTFYYHYADIPQLLGKTFQDWIDDVIINQTNKKALEDALKPLADSFLENRKEILNIYKNMDREIFQRNLDHLCTYIIDRYVDEATLNVDISVEEAQIVKRLYKCAIVGILLDWLDNEMNYDLFGAIIHIHELFDNKGLLSVYSIGLR